MFDTASLVVFIAATIALLLLPGPTVLYIVTRSLEQGRVAGFASTLGTGLANIVHVTCAALGLSVLLMQSALAFNFIKYLGAAYLIYLGVRTLMRKAQTIDIQNIQLMKHSQIFTQGFIVNLLNPKTALFFLSFLPQFVNPARGSVVLQIIILGLIFTSLAIVSDTLLVLIAGTARHFLTGNLIMARLQKYFAGTIYISLGISTALSGNGRIK